MLLDKLLLSVPSKSIILGNSMTRKMKAVQDKSGIMMVMLSFKQKVSVKRRLSKISQVS